MDTNVSNWIVEFLIQKCADDRLLDELLPSFSLKVSGSRIKKALLIRRIQVEVSKREISQKILELLELVGELDYADGKVASEKMREAYRAVAVDCTVKHLELEDYQKYGEVVQEIWRKRILKMSKRGGSGLVDEKTMSWMDDIEAASSNVEIRGKLLSMNTRYEAVKAIKSYCAEAYKEIGPSLLEKADKIAVSMRKAGTGKDAIMEDVTGEGQRLKGLEDISVAHKSPSRPSEKPFVDEIGGKQGSVDNANGAHKEVAPTGPSETAKNEINMREAGTGGDDIMEDVTGAEQTLDGLEDISEAHKSHSRPSEKLFVDKKQGFVENINEAHKEVAPTGSSETAKHVISMYKDGLGGDDSMEDAIGEEQRLEGLEDISEAHKSPSRPREKPFVDELGEEEEQGFVENVNEAHNEVDPCGRPCEKLSEDMIVEEQGLKGLGNVNEDHNEVAPTRPCERVSEDKIGEEQGLKDLGNVNEAHNEVALSGPCERVSEDKIAEEQGLKGLGNVYEAHNEVAPSGPCEKLSKDKTVKQKGLKDLNEARNKVASTAPCEKISEDKILKHKKLKGLRSVNEVRNEGTSTAPCEKLSEDNLDTIVNVNEAQNEVAPSGPCDNFSKDKTVEEQGLNGLGNVNEAHNVVTRRRRGEKPFVGRLEQGSKHSEYVNKALNDAALSGPCQKPSADTPHKQRPKRRKTVPVHKRTPKARLCDTDGLDKDTRMKKYPYLPTPEFDRAKAELKSSFADLMESVRDPLPEAIKISEQVSLDLKKKANVEGKRGRVPVRDPLPEATKNPERVSLVLIKDTNVEGDRGGGLDVIPTDNANQGLMSDPFGFDDNSLPKRVPRKKSASGSRRPKRKWTVIEEDTLRKGVHEIGRGNWKNILFKYRDVFEGRTDVDLKDKWRNLTRH